MYMPKQWIINNLFTKTLIDKLSKAAKKPFDSQFVNIKCDKIDTILELGDLETSYTNGRSLKEDILGGMPISGVLYCQTDVYYLMSTETDEGEDYTHVYLIYTSNNKSIKVTINGRDEEKIDVTRIEYVPSEIITVDDYVITLTVTVDPDTQSSTMSADKSVAEINAAIEAGKNCYAELEEEINNVTVIQRFYPTMYCATMVVFGGNLVAEVGSGVELDPVCIVGTHAGNMDTWFAVGN